MSPRRESEATLAIQEARTFLAEATALTSAGFPGPALRSALYAMEYAAQALLLLDGARVHADRAIVLAFAERVAELDTLPVESVGELSLVLAARQKSDYDAGFPITEDDAALGLERATRFLRLIEDHLPAAVREADVPPP